MHPASVTSVRTYQPGSSGLLIFAEWKASSTRRLSSAAIIGVGATHLIVTSSGVDELEGGVQRFAALVRFLEAFINGLLELSRERDQERES